MCVYGLGSFVRGRLRVSHLRRSARLRCFCAGQTEAMRCETCCVDRRNPLFSGALETCRSRKTLPSIDPILSPCAGGLWSKQIPIHVSSIDAALAFSPYCVYIHILLDTSWRNIGRAVRHKGHKSKNAGNDSISTSSR